MKVFYAHCMAIYDTPQETRDIKTLEALGFAVVNPNTPEHDACYKAQGIEYSARFVSECDAIVFRSLPDGRIPSGVSKEIAMFRLAGKPVLELPSGVESLRRVMSVKETRAYLVESGTR